MAHVKAFYEAKKVLKMASLASQGKVKGKSKSKSAVSLKSQSPIAMEEVVEEEVIGPVVDGGSDSSADLADSEADEAGEEEENEEEEGAEDEEHWMLGRLPRRMSEKSMQKSHKKREFESSPNSHCER